MATPRDHAAHTAPIETAEEATRLEASPSGEISHTTEEDAELYTGPSEPPENNDRQDQPAAGDGPSAVTRGLVAPTATQADEGTPTATPAEDEPRDTQDDSENIDRDDSDTDRAARDENSIGDTDRADVVSTTLPIRTSSVWTPSQAAPGQTAASPFSSTQTEASLRSESLPRRESSSRTQFVGPDGQVVDLASIMYPRRSSSIADSTPQPSSGRRSSLRRPFNASRNFYERHRRDTPEFVLPRWQPDAEVTLCPICNTQFSIWVRKHHCRKCGRVVCNSCSPHRITIPNQYIVRPPDSQVSFTTSLFADPMGDSYMEHDGMPGGERVRLCNPCVPDPNTAPPQSPTPLSPRSTHHRSRSSLSSAYGGMPITGRFGVLAGGLQAVNDPLQHSGSRTRSIGLNPSSRGQDPVPTSSRSASYQTPFERYMALRSGNSESSQFSTRPGFFEDVATSSRHRALPPTPQIAEEDECPVCHRELPATSLPDSEALREQHITACIQSHSTYGSPAPGNGVTVAPPAPRRSGMYSYPATEKDCVDDAECTICLEEFTVGVAMARLECLCRFHRACIAAWFVNHPGRCPVHQHDGFGF